MVPDLTVIIACRGRFDALERALAALERQTLAPARFEVILVDDGSSPPLPPLATALPLTILSQPPAGPAAARNRALSAARGAFVLFLNADAVPAPDLLERHLDHHAASPEPTCVLGRFDFLAEHLTPFVALADAAGSLFPYHLARPGLPLPFTFFWTGNLSAPTSAVREVGGFDERFRRALFEDLELGFRLAAHDVPLVFDPTLPCGHDHAITLPAWLARAETFGHEWVLFAQAHGERAFDILSTEGPPSDAELWAACLHEHAAQRARIAALTALLEASPERVPDDGPALFEPIHLIARMSGVLAARLGHTPEDLARHRRGRFPLALVHTLLDASDLDPLEALLDALPTDARLLLSHAAELAEPLAAHAVGTDPRATLIPFGDSPWTPLLAATDAETFILLNGSLVPSADELRELAAFLDLNPSLGAVTLGPPRPHPHWTAALIDPSRAPATVVATTRAVLANDAVRPPELGFFRRLAARGLRLALASPPR